MILRQEISFAVVKQNGVMIHIGRSEMLFPRIRFNGGTMKWFDDSRLARRQGNEQSAEKEVAELK
ncbi:MAG: hypothetical protein NC541_11120 [bacterium]|nr:hypothetical protein [bacterium]MCM1542652.1 hypothetical protein [Blautia sp.]